MKISAVLLVACSLAGVAIAQDSGGKAQLEKVFADRPDMKGIFPEDDVVIRWVIRKLDYGRSGETALWDNEEPVNGLADHLPSFGGKPALVRVTNRDDVSGRDRWYLLVFELFNLMHPDEVSALEAHAANGTVDRERFAALIVNHEYQQMVRTNQFFNRYPILGATPENAPLYVEYMAAMKETGMSKRRSDEAPKPNPDFPGHYEHYGRWYDSIRVYGPRQKAEQRRAHADWKWLDF